MNKIVIIAVFIFWGAVSFFYANNLVNSNQNQINNSQNINTNSSSGQLSTFGTELPSHNTENNCWLGINGKVYDVTGYIYSHPGGSQEIIKYCGQDATKVFSSKDKFIPQNHSQVAYDMLADYYIGDIAVNVSLVDNIVKQDQQPSFKNNQNTNNPPSSNPISYTITSALVGQHNSASDCWVTDGNKVYNVTLYIRSHPGGQSAITSYCGSDIGAAFRAQGHSANAVNIFAGMEIGTIGSTVSSDVINATPTAPSANNSYGDYDDDDDEWDDD